MSFALSAEPIRPKLTESKSELNPRFTFGVNSGFTTGLLETTLSKPKRGLVGVC